uniref:Uncharacterized protein n=1 Tax=Vombatus ursinus TaxID=29139 RepID=A0A4X2JTB9_VOMUR
MTEDHGLCNGDGPIKITKGLKLFIAVIAHHIVLFNGVQCLFLSFQFDDVWVWDNFPCKPPHRIFKGSREKQHLTSLREHPKRQHLVPLDADTLILMALGGYHHVSFIQNEHLDLFGINEFQLGAPIQNCARGTNYDLLADLLTSFYC